MFHPFSKKNLPHETGKPLCVLPFFIHLWFATWRIDKQYHIYDINSVSSRGGKSAPPVIFICANTQTSMLKSLSFPIMSLEKDTAFFTNPQIHIWGGRHAAPSWSLDMLISAFSKTNIAKGKTGPRVLMLLKMFKLNQKINVQRCLVRFGKFDLVSIGNQ